MGFFPRHGRDGTKIVTFTHIGTIILYTIYTIIILTVFIGLYGEILHETKSIARAPRGQCVCLVQYFSVYKPIKQLILYLLTLIHIDFKKPVNTVSY